MMNAEMQDLVEEAYDESGQVTEKTKDSFIKLINFFGSKLNNTDTEYTVRRMLYQQVAEKYGRVMKDKDGKDKKVTIYYHDKAGNELTKEVKKYGFSADAEGKKEDTWTLRMGWVAARAMAVVFGAQARNDKKAQG